MIPYDRLPSLALESLCLGRAEHERSGHTEDLSLAASVRTNSPDKARLPLDHVVNDRIQEMVDVSFQFCKLLNGDPALKEFFQEMMFKRYLRAAEG
jgi:hypothetical protein